MIYWDIIWSILIGLWIITLLYLLPIGILGWLGE